MRADARRSRASPRAHGTRRRRPRIQREFQINARTRTRLPRLAVRPRRFADERPRGQGTESPPGAALTSLLFVHGADGAAATDAATAWFEAVMAEIDGASAAPDEPPT